MKVKFPFKVKQVSPTEVEIVLVDDGRPLLSIELHPCLRQGDTFLISDSDMDKIFEEANCAVVKACVKVSI